MTLQCVNNCDGQSESLRIGLCQIYTEQWAVKENLRRTIAAIETAAKRGAQIAVTPECVLHGYATSPTNNFRQRLLKVSEPLDGSNLQLLCSKAREFGIYVLVGFIERGRNSKMYNAAAFISNTGNIINVYHKVHCRNFENINYDGFFTPGNKFTVTSLKIGRQVIKVGTMICFDREIPESVRCLRSLGAQIILCPLATNTYDATRYKKQVDNEIITRCRATENEVFIVVVNHSGKRKWANGGSFVVGPKGQLLCQMSARAGVCVIDVPISIVAKDFHSNPLSWMGWGYRRQKVYDKYLK